MKIGIFFGGVSREREISFAGAKTVYKTLDRSLFEPVPIFIDSFGNFIKIDKRFLEAEKINDFFPPESYKQPGNKDFEGIYAETLSEISEHDYREMIKQVGVRLMVEDLRKHIDFAFLMLHGTFAEDGIIQGLFEWFSIPYLGTSLFSSAFSIDKHLQKEVFQALGYGNYKAHQIVSRDEWLKGKNQKALFEGLKEKIGLPLVIKAPYQGSSIGVSILYKDDFETFREAVNHCFFLREIPKKFWTSLSEVAKHEYLQALLHINTGLGLPLAFEDSSLLAGDLGDIICYNAKELWQKLDAYFEYSDDDALISAFDSEDIVLFETHIKGREFSCGVLQSPEGKAVALPPTEIIAPNKIYDFEAKYKPDGSRKVIPIDIPVKDIYRIQELCTKIFEKFKFAVCARMDGFYGENGEITIIDVNTLPGMSPTSLIVRQPAEVGITPTNFLTYLIESSWQMRTLHSNRPYVYKRKWKNLSRKIDNNFASQKNKPQSAVLIAGFGDAATENFNWAREQFISLDSAESTVPIAIWWERKNEKNYFYEIPISVLLKPYIEEVQQAIQSDLHPAILYTIEQAKTLSERYAPNFKPRIVPIKLADFASQISQVYCACKAVPESVVGNIEHVLRASSVSIKKN
ncbi:MAG: hypothetical protein JJT94_00355 [Bernardetiaceae bacterium]|nr:hypothetical protein [Bernardetiaceae bacterium]